MVAIIELDGNGVPRVRIRIKGPDQHDEAVKLFDQIGPGVRELNKGIRGSERVRLAGKPRSR